MTKPFDFDILVIGAGSAGVRCSRVASQLGAKVAIVESRYLGGTCVNVGCVPKKLFVYASHFPLEVATANAYGWDATCGDINWSAFLTKKDREIQRLNDAYGNLLIKAGVEIIQGHAQFLAPNTVQVGERTITARNIVIAVGGWPQKGVYPGSELTITSNEIFHLPELPKRVAIEGGGYIAVEFAAILHGLGCDTTLIYRRDLFMRGFEYAMREKLAEAYRADGIHLMFDSTIEKIEKDTNGSLKVHLNGAQKIEVDTVLSAIGRRPMTDDLGLENAGVALTPKGTIEVDKGFKSSVDNIFALGDVVGRLPLTPVALAEGVALAHHLVKGAPIEVDYSKIPTAVFSQPEIATVGLTSQDAERQGYQVKVYSNQFTPMKYTLAERGSKTELIMVVDQKTDRVLGCHMIGDSAAEMMQGIAIAVNMGATKAQFDATIGIHPTSAEEWVTMR